MSEEKNKGNNSNEGKNEVSKINESSKNHIGNVGESTAKQEQLRKAMEVTPKPKPKEDSGKK